MAHLTAQWAIRPETPTGLEARLQLRTDMGSLLTAQLAGIQLHFRFVLAEYNIIRLACLAGAAAQDRFEDLFHSADCFASTYIKGYCLRSGQLHWG